MFTCSYVFGKLRGISFDLRQYDAKIIGIIFFRSFLSLISKSCQYAAIAYIPLALSSTISFTTGPIFAAIFAFVLIREKLSVTEFVTILLGILGTTILTMP
jgi:drug/metabolite transporter (DMT)-like permease